MFVIVLSTKFTFEFIGAHTVTMHLNLWHFFCNHCAFNQHLFVSVLLIDLWLPNFTAFCFCNRLQFGRLMRYNKVMLSVTNILD